MVTAMEAERELSSGLDVAMLEQARRGERLVAWVRVVAVCLVCAFEWARAGQSAGPWP